MLEMLVRFGLGTAVSPVRFQLIAMDVDDSASIQRIFEADLDPAWKARTAGTRAIGDAWLDSRASLVLVVPSAIVPRADNVLINPVHPDISRAAVVETMRVTLDERLLRS
jgi:RES domain-containing protein